MAKYLRCHTQGDNTTVGGRYEVAFEDDGNYVIWNDVGYREWFTIDPDGDGDSYRNWFILESDAISNSTAVSLATKRTQLATLTAEIAQLEAQLAEESRLQVGDYARVTDITSVDDFNEGDIVLITRADDSRDIYGLRGESVMSEDYEWFSPSALTKITSEQARASLIAKIDAHFGGQEAD